MRAIRDLGRWVCVRHPKYCDGRRKVREDVVRCPLAGKCLDPSKRVTWYEFSMPQLANGTYPELTTEHWDHKREHNRRYAQLLDAFAPERRKAQAAKYRESHREILNAKQRTKREKERKPREEKPKLTLPCGEDCENCPHDECPYGDRDEDALERQRYLERRRGYHRKNREKEREYKKRYCETHREQIAEYKKRYRETHREQLSEYYRKRWQRTKEGRDLK